MKSKAMVAILAVLLMASGSWAGWVVEEVTRDAGEVMTTHYFIQKGKAKFVMDDAIMIYDMNNGTLTWAHPEAEIYWTGTVDEIHKSMTRFQNQMMGEMQQSYMAEMQDYIKDLPPEQRAMVEEQMKQAREMMPQGDPDAGFPMGNMYGGESEIGEESVVKIRKTSDTETIAGYKAKKYEVMVDGDMAEMIWFSDDLQWDDVRDDFDLQAFQTMMDTIWSPPGMEDPFSYENTAAYREMMETGIPLKTVVMGDGAVSGYAGSMTEVISVEEKKLSKSDLDVPAGFREVELTELFQQMMSED